jgi:hypothetical protein
MSCGFSSVPTRLPNCSTCSVLDSCQLDSSQSQDDELLNDGQTLATAMITPPTKINVPPTRTECEGGCLKKTHEINCAKT